MLKSFNLGSRAGKWHPSSAAVFPDEGVSELFGGMSVGHFLEV
ncbi:hypothetical protein AADA15_19055 [Phycobacter sp. 'Weihai']